MKSLLFLIFFSSSFYMAQAQVRPVNPCTNVNFNASDGLYVSFYFTKPGSGAGANRVIIAKKGSTVTGLPTDGMDYPDNSTFGSGTQIAPGEFVVYDGAGTGAFIYNLEPNTTYYFAVFEYNGTGSNTLYLTSQYLSFSRSTATTPAAQTQSISFANVFPNSVKINCTLPAAGAGSARIILMKAGSPVEASAIPQDLTLYAANSIYGTNYQFPGGSYVVYSGTANTMTVTGLLANTTYHVAVMEYNGATNPVYRTASPAIGSFTTPERPTQSVTGVATNGFDGNGMNVRWTDAAANGIGRLVIAREGQPVTAVPVDGQTYTAGVNFGDGTEVMPGQFVMYKGINYNFDARKLKQGTTYYFTVFEYANGSAGPVYLTAGAPSAGGTTLSAPTQQAANLTISNVTNNSMKLSWVNGNGSNRIIVGRKGAPVNALPELFKKYYTGGFGYAQGLVSGDNYVLYDGAGAAGAGMSTTISGLVNASQYHFAVFEYNGYNGPVYLTTNAPVASGVTVERPTIAAQNLTFSAGNIEGNSLPVSWTNGNGSGRLVIAGKGAAVTAVPVDGVVYNTNNIFGSAGSTEIAPGEFVVYNGSNNSFTTNGLEIGTTYYFRVYEYAGSGSSIQYLTTSYVSGSKATLSAPLAGATNLVIDNVTPATMRLTWNVAPTGGGAYHLVIVKEAGVVDGSPVDLKNYIPSVNFSSGQTVAAGNYVVYYSTGNSVTVTGLKSATMYHYSIVEANGYYGPVYLNAAPLTGSSLTAVSLPVTWAGFSGIFKQNAVHLKWTTSAEVNNVYYAVERTANGAQFDSIGRVEANTGSNGFNNYSFTDPNPLLQTAYYRIKQVDKDGHFTYSKVLHVKSTEQGKIQLLQNPVHNSVTIKCSGVQGGSELMITDGAGRAMYKTTITGELVDVATDRLPVGLYYLYVRNKNSNEAITIPFVRQ